MDVAHFTSHHSPLAAMVQALKLYHLDHHCTYPSMNKLKLLVGRLAGAPVRWLLGDPQQSILEVIETRLRRTTADTDGTAAKLSGTVRMDQALGAKEAS